MAARIRWNLSAFEQVRRLPAVRDELIHHADAIAEACGEGFVSESAEGRTRSRAVVIAVTPQARRKNRKHNTILRATASRRVDLPPRR